RSRHRRAPGSETNLPPLQPASKPLQLSIDHFGPLSVRPLAADGATRPIRATRLPRAPIPRVPTTRKERSATVVAVGCWVSAIGYQPWVISNQLSVISSRTLYRAELYH